MAAADEQSAVVRPRRANVIASYDLSVERYEQLWSPVILKVATALAARMNFAERGLVLDVGAGTGALAPMIRAAQPRATVFALDASMAMLRLAHVNRQLPAIQADAMVLPVAASSVDAVIVAFVLFHLEDPLAALKEAARVLRTGGEVGTATWASERIERAEFVFADTLERAGVPALPAGRVDTGLDSPVAMERILGKAGLVPRQVWMEWLCHQWDAESFFALATGRGGTQRRLALLDAEARASVLERLREEFAALGPEDYLWEGESVCAVAVKADS